MRLIPSGYHKSTGYILEQIEKSYMEPLFLSSFAAELHFSLPYVSKCFHEDTGQTFTEYLCGFRLRQSARLLANTRYSIARVARLCGFTDIKWFNRKFKLAFGATPSQHRASKG